MDYTNGWGPNPNTPDSPSERGGFEWADNTKPVNSPTDSYLPDPHNSDSTASQYQQPDYQQSACQQPQYEEALWQQAGHPDTQYQQRQNQHNAYLEEQCKQPQFKEEFWQQAEPQDTQYQHSQYQHEQYQQTQYQQSEYQETPYQENQWRNPEWKEPEPQQSEYQQYQYQDTQYQNTQNQDSAWQQAQFGQTFPNYTPTTYSPYPASRTESKKTNNKSKRIIPIVVAFVVAMAVFVTLSIVTSNKGIDGKYTLYQMEHDGQIISAKDIKQMKKAGMDFDMFALQLKKGKCTLKFMGIPVEGTYKVSGKNITLSFQGDTTQGQISGKKITFEIVEGNDRTILVFQK